MAEAENPTITFALFAYNQERFIREAVEGALSQTYSPLEIILSDDHSTDSTFEIIEDAASQYAGPHRIKTIRNPRNLGIGRHINRVMEIATGDLIVGAAGDDVSLPERTSTLASVWLEKHRADLSIYSSYEVVDAVGNPIETRYFPAEHLKNDSLDRIFERVRIVGPTHAWSRSLFREFGGMEFGAVNEDSIIQFRASLKDGVVIVPDVLTKYRLHSSNISNLESQRSRVSALRRRAESSLIQHRRGRDRLKNYEKDLLLVVSESKQPYSKELEAVRLKLATWELRVLFAEGSPGTRIRCVFRAIRARLGWSEVLRMLIRMFMPRAS